MLETPVASTPQYPPSAVSDLRPTGVDNWIGELAVHDLSWVATTAPMYASVLKRLPDVFAWSDAPDTLWNLKNLDRSMNIWRLSSFFDHIARYDKELAKMILDTFNALPAEGKVRFMTAPETHNRISRLGVEPSRSIIQLCTFLNGESAYYGIDPIRKGYCTALGDFYISAEEAIDGCSTDRDEELCVFRAPRLADAIPIDFYSPNRVNVDSPSCETNDLSFSPEEESSIADFLNRTFNQISEVCAPAGELIKQYVKVIIPLKVKKGIGSTSQPRFPGRVLLRGTDRCSAAALASALVHESIHQLIYVLEYAGAFIMRDAEPRNNLQIKSLWTGRDLELHSFLHACFVWYGLGKFWERAGNLDVFEKAEVDRELERSLRGYRGENPAQLLQPFAGVVRQDVITVAGMLQQRLTERAA
jgi:hypothetical protein